jgi:AraC-like DNA-binding protein
MHSVTHEPTAASPHTEAARRCVTDDIDEFTAKLNDVFYPAKVLLTSGGTGRTRAELAAAKLSLLTIGRARFGSAAEVDPGDIGGYHVNVPLFGSVASRCGTQEIVATPERAAVFTPSEHTVLPLWEANATQVCIKIEKASLETELARILGRPVDGRVRFRMDMDLTTPSGARWLSMVKILVSVIDELPARAPAGLAPQVEYLERALIAGLIMNQPHSMSGELFEPVVSGNTRAVQRVLEYVDTRPGHQFTVADLAAAAGVGTRQLQKLFNDQFGMSPTTYVRHLRLDGVRTELLEGLAETTVSDTAFRWGFNHMGRFAGQYEKKFGETPSQTIRARRGGRIT